VAPHARLVVVVGVAGSGKSTVGRLLAQALGVPFADADDFHAPAARARMAKAQPLDDALRGPWLDALHARLEAAAAAGRGVVLACSALKQGYRDRLAADLEVVFVHLDVDRATLEQRLRTRSGHFFPPALLESQLATWEPLRDGIVVDGRQSPERIVEATVGELRARSRGRS
jgi:gluconokinase